jgi:hypothetical protein
VLPRCPSAPAGKSALAPGQCKQTNKQTTNKQRNVKRQAPPCG